MWTERTFEAGTRNVDRYRQWVSLIRELHHPSEGMPEPTPPWMDAETELRPDC
jgi:hypothetical protein